MWNLLETAARNVTKGSPEMSQTSASVEEARPEVLLGAAGALKEIVGVLVSDIKANAEVQKLMPAMQRVRVAKHHAFFQDLMDIPENQQSCSGDVISTPRDETLVRTFSKDARTVKRSARKGQMICKHSCEHRAEVVDPGLWRNLPEELVELICAKLPLPLIVELRECSEAWYTMSKTSSNFKEACSESHPNLFGLLGWDYGYGTLWITLLDDKSKEWIPVELVDFPASDCYSGAYRNSMYACDGGLVCFVPSEHLTSLPILVCNLLTSIWKSLPLISVEDFQNKKLRMVQLVVEDDTKLYQVILASQEKTREAKVSVHFYSSKTGTWSIMDSGLVYGCSSYLKYGHGTPYAFDCTTKKLFDLSGCAALARIDSRPFGYSLAKDHMLVLHEFLDRGRLRLMHVVSEYTWDTSLSDLRKLNDFESPIEAQSGYSVGLFASPSFVLLLVDNCAERDEDHHQFITLFDMAASRWGIPPPLLYGNNIHCTQLYMLFMVELRWNINR